MGKYIGIDLGTTFSCMAYINDNGLPEIIPNSEGDAITPSTVLFEDGLAAILCNYRFDMEHGLAVLFENGTYKSVGSQDTVL